MALHPDDTADRIGLRVYTRGPMGVHPGADAARVYTRGPMLRGRGT
jgi:hypothetical protein